MSECTWPTVIFRGTLPNCSARLGWLGGTGTGKRGGTRTLSVAAPAETLLGTTRYCVGSISRHPSSSEAYIYTRSYSPNYVYMCTGRYVYLRSLFPPLLAYVVICPLCLVPTALPHHPRPTTFVEPSLPPPPPPLPPLPPPPSLRPRLSSPHRYPDTRRCLGSSRPIAVSPPSIARSFPSFGVTAIRLVMLVQHFSRDAKNFAPSYRTIPATWVQCTCIHRYSSFGVPLNPSKRVSRYNFPWSIRSKQMPATVQRAFNPLLPELEKSWI